MPSLRLGGAEGRILLEGRLRSVGEASCAPSRKSESWPAHAGGRAVHHNSVASGDDDDDDDDLAWYLDHA